MHFHIINVMNIQPCLSHDFGEENFLSWCVRMRDRHCVCRMVCGSPQDDTKDSIIVGFGIFESLDDDGANAVTSAV